MTRELKTHYITKELGEGHQEESLLEAMLDELTDLYGETIASELIEYVEIDSYDETFESDFGPVDGEIFIAKYISTWMQIRLVGYILDQEQVFELLQKQRAQDERDYRRAVGF